MIKLSCFMLNYVKRQNNYKNIIYKLNIFLKFFFFLIFGASFLKDKKHLMEVKQVKWWRHARGIGWLICLVVSVKHLLRKTFPTSLSAFFYHFFFYIFTFKVALDDKKKKKSFLKIWFRSTNIQPLNYT